MTKLKENPMLSCFFQTAIDSFLVAATYGIKSTGAQLGVMMHETDPDDPGTHLVLHKVSDTMTGHDALAHAALIAQAEQDWQAATDALNAIPFLKGLPIYLSITGPKTRPSVSCRMGGIAVFSTPKTRNQKSMKLPDFLLALDMLEAQLSRLETGPMLLWGTEDNSMRANAINGAQARVVMDLLMCPKLSHRGYTHRIIQIPDTVEITAQYESLRATLVLEDA